MENKDPGQELLHYIFVAVCDHKDNIVIKREVDERGVLLTAYLNPEDLGRAIGKKGANAQALRTLLRAVGMRHDARYSLKIESQEKLDD